MDANRAAYLVKNDTHSNDCIRRSKETTDATVTLMPIRSYPTIIPYLQMTYPSPLAHIHMEHHSGTYCI